MYASLFSILNFTCAVVYLFLIGYILIKGPKSPIKWILTLFLGSFLLWNIGDMFVLNPSVPLDTVKLMNNIGAIGWLCLGGFFFWFVLVFTGKDNILNNMLFYISLFTIQFYLILNQWFGSNIIGEYRLEKYGWTFSWMDTGWTYLFFVYFGITVIAGLLLLASYRRKTKFDIKKKQAGIMILAGLIAVTLGAFTNILSRMMGYDDIAPFGAISSIIWTGGIFYVISRYNFLIVTPEMAAESIMENMTDGLFILDDKGNIISTNNTVIKMLGYNKEELAGKSIDDFFTKEKIIDYIKKKSSIGIDLKNIELGCRAKNGKVIPALLSTSLLKDNNNRIIAIVCAYQDITEIKKGELELEKKAEELKEKIDELHRSKESLAITFDQLAKVGKKLEEGHNKVSAVIANFMDPILVFNNEGKLDIYNDAAVNVLGVDAGDKGKKFIEKGDYHLEHLRTLIRKDYTVGQIKSWNEAEFEEEEISLIFNGHEKTYKVTTVEIDDGRGGHLGMMKIFYDLTKERALDKIKSSFISIAAHQLRTPLSAIKWSLRMVLSGDTGRIDKQQRNVLEKGCQRNEAVIKLVDDMLNVSKIEEGRFGYNFKKGNLFEVLNSVIGSLENQIKQKKINLTLEKISNSVENIIMDKEKIFLAFQNFIENSVKYTPKNGRIKISVSQEKDTIKLLIQDNGLGIPKKDMPNIFKKFFRAENVKKVKLEGTGLGLFIAKNIIEKHNGEVKLESEEGRGTVISIYLLGPKASRFA